jgi:Pentapeptide repeats (8 copies)
MIARFRSWWKNTSKTLDAVIITSLVILLALVVLIILGYIYNWTWAGLHGKTLYDWLQLLIIPTVLALGGYLFNYTTGRTEREIASNRQQEEALQVYIDSLSELLLHEKLRQSAEDDEVRKIARVRTLTVLPRLDRRRKASVVQFLHESGLIDKRKRIVNLTGADLGEADLRGANLTSADLDRADLFVANLHEANLNGAWLVAANLSKADLRGANLSEADLRGAIVTTEQLDQAASLKGATIPDGSVHP